MTFREKYEREHGKKLQAYSYCPRNFGYEPACACDADIDIDCTACWNREIPEIEDADEFDKIDIYPLTIVADRYNGTYSGGKFTAWNKDVYDIPESIDSDDLSCSGFWRRYRGLVGKGPTPNEAVKDLWRKMEGSK